MATTYDQSTVTYDQSSLTYQGTGTVFGVGFAVEMAFGYNPLDASPQWTPVTPYVRGFSTDRGRTSEFVDYSPGTASILLDNRDRRFDPEYTSGPYYGQLNPMVPVRIQATYSGVTYTMYTGFVQGWPTAYNQSNTDAVATVQCVDANRLLANLSLPVDPFTDYLSTLVGVQYNAYWPFQFEDETVVDPLNPSQSQPVRPTPVGIAGIRNAAQVKGQSTGTYNAQPGVISVWVVRGVAEPVNQQVVAEGAESTGPSYRTLIDLDIRDDVIYVGVGTSFYRRITASTSIALDSSLTLHHVVVGETQLWVNGVQRATWSLSAGTFPGSFTGGNPVGINPDYTSGRTGRIAHLSVGYGAFPSSGQIDTEYSRGAVAFGGELSSVRLGRALDDAGWPASFRQIETGVQTVGSYRPVALPTVRYVEQVESAEQGALFVNAAGEVEFQSRTTAESVSVAAIIDDTGTHLPFAGVTVDAHTVDAIRNNVVVNYANGTVTSTDAGSVTAYGQATQTVDAQLVDDPDVAQLIGDNLLVRAKDPRTRITSLSVNMRRDPVNLVPAVASLDLADDVVVSLTPTGVGDPLWRAVSVQGLSHTVTPQSWDVTMYLAPGPVATNGPLLILDDGVYGELDSTNKLG